MPAFIRKRTLGELVTVYEAPSWKEAIQVCAELQRKDADAYYYVTRRCSQHRLHLNEPMKLISGIVAAAAVALTALPAYAQYAMTCTREYNSSVNLRSGPSKNNYVVASVPNDSYVRTLNWVWGSDGMRWYRVEHSGLVGWMRSDYLCR